MKPSDSTPRSPRSSSKRQFKLEVSQGSARFVLAEGEGGASSAEPAETASPGPRASESAARPRRVTPRNRRNEAAASAPEPRPEDGALVVHVPEPPSVAETSFQLVPEVEVMAAPVISSPDMIASLVSHSAKAVDVSTDAGARSGNETASHSSSSSGVEGTPDSLPHYLTRAIAAGITLAVVFRIFAGGHNNVQKASNSSTPVATRGEGSRLLESGVTTKIQRWLDAGEYVVAAADDKGHLSTRLILDELRSKDLAIAQKLARHKSAQLEQPLFIIARGATPEAAPRVIDRVNPSDEQAYRQYMLSLWHCKEKALARSREEYTLRAALDPEETVHRMSAFIEEYPDSRLVDEALKDMRYVSYFVLQDPGKFSAITHRLVDKALLTARVGPGYSPEPELARAAAPYLKEAVNQSFYQRIYRLRSGVASDVMREQN